MENLMTEKCVYKICKDVFAQLMKPQKQPGGQAKRTPKQGHSMWYMSDDLYSCIHIFINIYKIYTYIYIYTCLCLSSSWGLILWLGAGAGVFALWLYLNECFGGQDINQIAKTPQAVGQKDKGHSRQEAYEANEPRLRHRGMWQGGEHKGGWQGEGALRKNWRKIFGLMFALTNSKS